MTGPFPSCSVRDDEAAIAVLVIRVDQEVGVRMKHSHDYYDPGNLVYCPLASPNSAAEGMDAHVETTSYAVFPAPAVSRVLQTRWRFREGLRVEYTDDCRRCCSEEIGVESVKVNRPFLRIRLSLCLSVEFTRARNPRRKGGKSVRERHPYPPSSSRAKTLWRYATSSYGASAAETG